MAWGAQIHGVENQAPEIQAAIREGEQAGLEELGIKGAEMVQRNIATPYEGKPAAVASENLLSSINSKFEWLPDAAHEIIGVNPQLGADKYAAPVETGARPHMPPPESLLLWVQRKFGVDDEKEALSVAFAVAKTIAKRGTSGHQMFSRGLEELQPLVPGALEHNIALALARHGFVGGGQ
jgi:hypothetical protein